MEKNNQLEINKIIINPGITGVIFLELRIGVHGILEYIHISYEDNQLTTHLRDIKFDDKEDEKAFLYQIKFWVEENPFILDYLKNKPKIKNISEELDE